MTSLFSFFRSIWAALLAAAVVSLTQGSQAAEAADIDAAPEVINEQVWYLRIESSLARNDSVGFSQTKLTNNGGFFSDQNFGTQGVFAIGVGRRLSNWLRFDFASEYREPASFSALAELHAELKSDERLDVKTQYTGRLSSFSGLANVYLDVPRGGHVTPYIGAGIGFARNTMSRLKAYSEGTLTDPATGKVDVIQPTFARSPSHSEWGLAWALMAGLAIDISPSTQLDIGYRYIDLGSSASAISDLIYCICGEIGSPLKADDLRANEFRIGLRWQLDRPADEPRHTPMK